MACVAIGMKTKPNRTLGLLAAVAVVWALLVPLPLLVSLVDSLWWTKTPPVQWPSFGEAFGAVILMGVVGLPLSLLFCFMVGYPAWLVANRRGLRRPRDAALVGALVAMVLDLLLMFPEVAVVAIDAPGQHGTLMRMVLLDLGIGSYIAAVGAVAGVTARWAYGTQSLNGEDMARLFA